MQSAMELALVRAVWHVLARGRGGCAAAREYAIGLLGNRDAFRQRTAIVHNPWRTKRLSEAVCLDHLPP